MSGDKIKPQVEGKELDNKKLLELRRIRGIGIISKGDTPQIIDSETFFVPSQSSKKLYKVKHIENWECECQIPNASLKGKPY